MIGHVLLYLSFNLSSDASLYKHSEVEESISLGKNVSKPKLR